MNVIKKRTTYNCPMLQGTLTTKADSQIAPDGFSSLSDAPELSMHHAT